VGTLLYRVEVGFGKALHQSIESSTRSTPHGHAALTTCRGLLDALLALPPLVLLQAMYLVPFVYQTNQC
jgi:hypothetical protein